jgi:hypothetical protein
VVFGNAITDAHGKASSSADTTLLADGNGTLRLNGYKFYSTGTLFAAHPPRRCRAVRRLGRFGKRLTASGGTRFTDVEVHPVEVTTVSDGAHLGHSTTLLQLYLAARAEPRSALAQRPHGRKSQPARVHARMPRETTRSTPRGRPRTGTSE